MPYRINSNLYDHAQIFCKLNYDLTPMAPPDIKVLLCERAKISGSWSPHTLSWWYIIPILEHYHCRQMWIPSTNSSIIGKNVSLFPHKITIPTSTATNIIIATAKYLTEALKQTNKNHLLPPSDTITCKLIFQLDSIFSNASSEIQSQQSPSF